MVKAKYVIGAMFVMMGFLSCKKEVKENKLVYSNDFESGDLTNISNGKIDVFNSTHVLGRYNSGDFALSLGDLPKHDLVQISFDLYIHDTWDGNLVDNGYSGPDVWKMLVQGQTYINTTFSNAACPVNQFCLPQSYPDNYPNNSNNPRIGASDTNLPGACYLKSDPNGSTLYKISKTISHTSATLLLQCLDNLVQKNVADKSCDESWSIDNLQVKIITL